MNGNSIEKKIHQMELIIMLGISLFYKKIVSNNEFDFTQNIYDDTERDEKLLISLDLLDLLMRLGRLFVFPSKNSNIVSE